MNTQNIISKIINEEYQKFLNEDVVGNEDNFRFTNELKMYNNVNGTTEMQIIFQNYSTFSSDYDVDIIDAYLYVTWKIGFEANSYGIKNFFINIEKVEGQYRIEMHDKQSDEVVQTTDKNIGDNQWKFEVDEDTMMKVGGSLFVEEILFDFSANLCTVKFNSVEQ